MTLMVAILLCFIVLLCLSTFKTLLAIVALTALALISPLIFSACLLYWPYFSISPSKGSITMEDQFIVQAIHTISQWDQDSAFSCVTSLAALRYRD